MTAPTGSGRLPVVRTVSMNGWMGWPNTAGGISGYRLFRKTTDIIAPSPSETFVFLDERDDSIDDCYFATDMATHQLVNFPASYHGGSAASPSRMATRKFTGGAARNYSAASRWVRKRRRTSSRRCPRTTRT